MKKKKQNCRDHTTGDECELCEDGYTGDATQGTSNDCRPEGGSRPQTCSCDPRGSLRPDCPDGRSCSCKVNTFSPFNSQQLECNQFSFCKQLKKANCEGARCDRCREGSFGLMEQNPQGCLTCFCSGVTRECNSAKLYRSQITMQIIDTQHGFTLSERYDISSSFPRSNMKTIENQFSIRNGVSVPNLRIGVDQNEISYTYSSTPSRSPKLYWSLPSQFTGNKVRRPFIVMTT